jgi:hypothetical protein
MKKVAGFGLRIAGFILLVSCSSNRQEYLIGVGERIHHGKFEYSASDVIITRFLKNGSDTLHAKGMFYLVKFKVENNSKRTGHEWDNSIAYIIDDRAGSFQNMSVVQEFYEKSKPFGFKEKYITAPGSSDSTYLAFDLPFSVTIPFLKIKGNFMMRDIFDGALFRRVRIKLY